MNRILILSSNEDLYEDVKLVTSENDLGNICCMDPAIINISNNIKHSNPDILIIDHSFKDKSGLLILKDIYNSNLKLHTIFILEDYNDDTVIEAYKYGAHFVIKSPIHYHEVLAIVKHIDRYIKLENCLLDIQSITNNIANSNFTNTNMLNITFEDEINNILIDLGVLGELGCKNIVTMLRKIKIYKKKYSTYLLQDIYSEIAYIESSISNSIVNSNTIEQRIRRVVQKSLTNIAEIGLDDYSSPIFNKYSTCLFDFQQVRQEMNFLKGKTKIPGKVNIKRFAEGILSLI